jgi:hypothetical protein
MQTAEVTPGPGSNGQNEELYKPSAAVLEQAYIKDWDAVAREADADFVGFWEARAKELIDLDEGARRLGQTILQVVRRRQDEHRPQRHRPASQDPPAQ